MKNTKKLISVLLVAMLLISTLVATGVTASAATGTLASYYKTNPNGFGKEKTISIDGSISDWDSSMLIAQGTANDDPRVYRPNSMYEVPVDLYALYGAYDDSNLYLMWEMTNVQDIVAPDDNYPLSQGTLFLTQEFPFFIVIDTGKSSDAIGNSGKLQTGGTLWNSGLTIQNSFNRIISINTKGGNGPFVYGGDSSGVNAKEIYDRTTSKVKMGFGKGILSSKVNGINGAYGANNNRVVGDMCNESAAWVDFNTKGHASSSLDFFYELSIPYSELGISKSDVAGNGVGAMVIATMGKSALDCLPYDLAMNDNADLDDSAGSQENNSFKKSDDDNVTVAFARIGKQGDTPVTQPTTPTQPTTAPTQPTTEPDVPSTTLKVNTSSNFFSSSSLSDLEVGDTVSVKYDLTVNKSVASAQWKLEYDSSKLTLKSVDGPTGSVINTDGNPVYGNFTDVSNMFDFSAGDTFVQAEFEVKATGTTNVNLTVDELNLGTKSGSSVTLTSLVENGAVKTVSGVTSTASSQTTKGGVVADTITINAKSNLFDSATATFDENTNKVTVSYQLKSSVKAIDGQWQMTYDSNKLTLDSVSMPKVTAPVFGSPSAGVATGNFTDTNLADFTSMGDFVSATFTVKGKGTATVNLDVLNLGIAKFSGNSVSVAYLVNNGTVKDITGTFPGYTYSTKTLINAVTDFIRGDVNQDGLVSIQDATLLQRYLCEYTTLTAEQLLAADANKDGKVNIKDVTTIQRALANKEVIPD